MLQFINKNCAYHTNQQLTNFCSCRQCLLPVCPTCIKVHSQQHLRKGSMPQFQKLGNVFNQVYEGCSNIGQGLQRLKEELLEVEKVKKQNQALILEKIKLYRNKLIREFERVLMDVECQMVSRFQEQDEKFITQIEKIDRNIEMIEKEVSFQLKELEGQDGLRAVIFHLSRNYQIECLKAINGLNQRIKQMLTRNIYLQVEEDRVAEVKQAVNNYLKLGTIEWGSGNNTLESYNLHNKQTHNQSSDGPKQYKPFEAITQINSLATNDPCKQQSNHYRQRVNNQL